MPDAGHHGGKGSQDPRSAHVHGRGLAERSRCRSRVDRYGPGLLPGWMRPEGTGRFDPKSGRRRAGDCRTRGVRRRELRDERVHAAGASRGGRACLWRAVLAAQEKDGVLHEATSTEFSFATKPHATSVNVWGLPSAIAAGERFRFKVGIKCSAGCKLAGRPLRVLDDEGAASWRRTPARRCLAGHQRALFCRGGSASPARDRRP